MTSTPTSDLLTVRSARPDDAAEVVRIYIESSNAGFGPLMGMGGRTVTPRVLERWRNDLSKPIPQRWWVAEWGGLTVGFAGIGPSREPVDPRLGELDTIAVDPPYWRNGVGRALMSVVLRHLAADGYDDAVVWTVAGYERGQSFYEATGWTLDGGRRDDGAQIRYRLPLKQKPAGGSQV